MKKGLSIYHIIVLLIEIILVPKVLILVPKVPIAPGLTELMENVLFPLFITRITTPTPRHR